MHSVTLPQFSSASVPQVSESKLNSVLVSEPSLCIFLGELSIIFQLNRTPL